MTSIDINRNQYRKNKENNKQNYHIIKNYNVIFKLIITKHL